MDKRSKLEYIKLDDLKLDINNPRFAELYTGSTKEEDLIEYLLYDEAAEEIARAIVRNNEFYEDKALWVIKDSDGKYLVKDGNRRCAAVKALQMPGKYELALSKTTINELPVYIYYKMEDLQGRISEEHAASLFRSWERIAKALQIIDLANAGKNEEMLQLDSKPGDFIKLGTFYKEAVMYGKEELKRQIRRGRGRTGGKATLYERLFRDAKLCGYKFKNSPSFQIEIIDRARFESYINAFVKYNKENPDLKTKDLDYNKGFIKELKDYGFDAYSKISTTEVEKMTEVVPILATTKGLAADSVSTGMPGIPSGMKKDEVGSSSKNMARTSTKKYPEIKRKKFPAGLKARIDEYFRVLDSSTASNSKMAMGRILFECVLKYVVEETMYNGKTYMSKSGYFGPAYVDSKFTDFRKMKHKFIDLITSTKDRNAMLSFDLDHLHQVVHNYKVSGISTVAEQVSSNLIPLIEFMLQDEVDLLNSLDLTKIK
ncbi:hypothetical protein D3C87_352700 [compost metagenome]